MADSGNKRIGISALSKQNRSIAYNQELLVDKLTGELLIKTDNGDVVSYNYNARLAHHIDMVMMRAQNAGICGKIYSVIPDNVDGEQYEFPAIVAFNDWDSINNVVIDDTTFKKVLVSVDAECILIGGENEISTVQYEPLTVINYRAHAIGKTEAGLERYFMGAEALPLGLMNETVVMPTDYSGTAILDKLNELKIRFNIKNDDDDTIKNNCRMLVHSILVVLGY